MRKGRSAAGLMELLQQPHGVVPTPVGDQLFLTDEQ